MKSMLPLSHYTLQRRILDGSLELDVETIQPGRSHFPLCFLSMVSILPFLLSGVNRMVKKNSALMSVYDPKNLLMVYTPVLELSLLAFVVLEMRMAPIGSYV